MSRDTLSAKAVSTDLGTAVIGQNVIYHDSLPSTMTEAAGQARSGAAEGTVVIAGEQTAGRGRLNRAWLAPGGNIALSVIVRPDIDTLPSMVMLASLAVAGSIESVTGLKPGIKWPNDVLIGGRKVCGILIENGFRSGKLEHSVIGIGIDVNLELSQHPEIASIATSLSTELGRPVSRLEMVRELLREMDRLYHTLLLGESLFPMWRDRLVTLGRRVRVTDGDQLTEGLAESVEADGSLMLRTDDGHLSRIMVGDVSLRQ